MRSWIARRMLRATSKRYGYDAGYLEMMLKESPSAFFKFASLMKAAGHREVIAVDASFAAKLVGALAEDCGPCTQLCVDMALQAGMPKDQVEAVLAQILDGLSSREFYVAQSCIQCLVTRQRCPPTITSPR